MVLRKAPANFRTIPVKFDGAMLFKAVPPMGGGFHVASRHLTGFSVQRVVGTAFRSIAHERVSPEWHLVKAYISELQRLTCQQWVLGFRRASPRVAAGHGENTGLFSGLEVAAAETQRGPKNRWKARVFAGP